MSIEQTLRSLTPHVIGVDLTWGLPQPDPADSVTFMYEWFEKGIPEYRLLTSAALFLLNLSASFPEMLPGDLAGFKRQKPKASDYMAASAYHPRGTCRMGGDPDQSVVSHTGEAWDLEKLFTCDGSVIPTSLGVNPQMTIFALAMRCAGFVDDEFAGYTGGV